jgi:UDP-2-acetamido-3-amino-2,3-dideoxy-glucuronate N-acetyltransferase
MNYFVHATAVVDENVSIGRGTRIWHFSHIMPGVNIGEDCNFGQNTYIDAGVQVGNRVKIQNNVSVYKGVVIEDDVFVGPSVVFTNVINPRSFIERRHEIKPTLIQKGATIGANATIICGVQVGRYAMIGAGSVVTHNVDAYSLVMGNPAKETGKVNEAGERVS